MAILGLTTLLPASFRGVPFGVSDQSTIVGRRLAVHEYPGREDVWTEDMGRGATRYRIRGFLLDGDRIYVGGPVELQRTLLYTATKAPGVGVLIHPALGILKVLCENCAISEALDGGTYSQVELSFVEAGKQSFPGLSIDGLGSSPAVLAAITAVGVAMQVIGLAGRVASGAASGALPKTSAQWSGQTVALGRDATALSRLVAALPGNFGRYTRGATTGYVAAVDPNSSNTLPQLVALAAEQRATITKAAAAVDSVVAALTVSSTDHDYAAAVSNLIGSLATACADPADALRLLQRLIDFAPAGVDAASADGAAVSDVFLRAATLELVRVASTYQPSSYEDAFALLVRVTDALDAAMGRASAAGQDDLYAALRTLRVAIVEDLRARGATLAHVRTFALGTPMPSVVVAQRLYRDPDRAEELVGEAAEACVHPLFMPTSIQALAA